MASFTVIETSQLLEIHDLLRVKRSEDRERRPAAALHLHQLAWLVTRLGLQY